jgi:nucleoside-diphosphate-sugar epimerase
MLLFRAKRRFSMTKIVVTGAFSYTGKYITRRLLDKGAQVVTLTNHPDRPDPFAGRVKAFPLDFGQETRLAAVLSGADALVIPIGCVSTGER